MPWTPGVVPYGADQTVYLVVDTGTRGSELEIERADLESVISDLISGRFNDPVRVVAFNTLEHWARDLSADIASEIQARFDIAGDELPEHVRDFVAANSASVRQLSAQPA
jgi:hypothetical protein